MSLLRWIVIAAASVVLGVAVVKYLVAPPLNMALWLLAVVGLAVGLVLLVLVGLRGRARLGAVGVILVGVMAGYLGTTYVFLNTEEERDLPELAVPSPDKRDHAAVRAIKERVDACRPASQ